MLEDPYAETGPEETAKAAEALRHRGSLEEAEAQMLVVIEQIAAVGSELVPGLTWYWIGDRSQGQCLSRPYAQTDAEKVRLPSYLSDTNIPDEIWPRYLERVREILAPLGLTAPAATQEKPGHHVVHFYNPDTLMKVRVSTQINSQIAGEVGCYLPRAALEKSTHPTP